MSNEQKAWEEGWEKRNYTTPLSINCWFEKMHYAPDGEEEAIFSMEISSRTIKDGKFHHDTFYGAEAAYRIAKWINDNGDKILKETGLADQPWRSE